MGAGGLFIEPRTFREHPPALGHTRAHCSCRSCGSREVDVSIVGLLWHPHGPPRTPPAGSRAGGGVTPPPRHAGAPAAAGGAGAGQGYRIMRLGAFRGAAGAHRRAAAPGACVCRPAGATRAGLWGGLVVRAGRGRWIPNEGPKAVTPKAKAPASTVCAPPGAGARLPLRIKTRSSPTKTTGPPLLLRVTRRWRDSRQPALPHRPRRGAWGPAGASAGTRRGAQLRAPSDVGAPLITRPRGAPRPAHSPSGSPFPMRGIASSPLSRSLRQSSTRVTRPICARAIAMPAAGALEGPKDVTDFLEDVSRQYEKARGPVRGGVPRRAQPAARRPRPPRPPKQGGTGPDRAAT